MSDGLNMLHKIVSGGQTGVDRAALDVALALGIPCGGWCPKGRRAEDGIIAVRYPLTETEGSNYSLRTEWNVRDSDATLILNEGALEGGTKITAAFAEKYQRPCYIISMQDDSDSDKIKKWIRQNRVQVLNVAGPRESGRPGIYKKATALLSALLCDEVISTN